MGPQSMSLEDRIITVGVQIKQIAKRLFALGYEFEDRSAVFPGPERDTDSAIARIEREMGKLPLAIKLFWRRVGSVNLIGRHTDWKGCEYPDPLFVYPPSMALDELESFLEDREERLRCNYPYFVPIAPDAKHKENVSGGGCYNLRMPAIEDDPLLEDEPHQTTFVNYLELAVLWGGFPGLERCTDHRWPLEKILDTGNRR